MQGKNLTFYIANKKYLYYSFYAQDGVADGATGLKVDKSDWDNGIVPPDVQNKINRLSYLVKQHVSRCQIGDLDILKNDIVNIIQEETGKKKKATALKSLSDIILEYYHGISKGTITNDGKKYSKSAVDLVEYILNDFGVRPVKRGPIGNPIVIPKKMIAIGQQSISLFTQSELEAYRASLVARGSSHNTISIRNNMMLTILKRTKGYGWHDNVMYRDEGLFIKPEEVDYGITYTVEELERLYQTELEARLIKYRDVFIAGSFLCLRYVDHQENNLSEWVSGDFLTVNTKKKGTDVAIPLHPIVKEIMSKYPDGLPKLSDDGFRKRIRQVCKLAGFDDLVLFSRTQGGKRISEMIPRYELTGTHTMRRNFATNALLAGVPRDWVKKIGGWKSDRSFEKYNRMTIKQVAEQAIKHPFFSQGFGNQ